MTFQPFNTVSFSPLMRDFLFLTVCLWVNTPIPWSFQSLDEGFFISNRIVRDDHGHRSRPFQSLDEGFFISNS